MKLRYIAPAVAAATLLLAGTGVAYAQEPTVDPLAACQAAAETLATEQARLDEAVAADKAAADAAAADKAEKAAVDALVLAQANANAADPGLTPATQVEVEARIVDIRNYLALNKEQGGPTGADRRTFEQRLELRRTQLAAIIDLAAKEAEADKTDAVKLAKTADKTNAADLTIVRDAALKARGNACGTSPVVIPPADEDPAVVDRDCTDFPTQAEAQAVLEADATDPNHLDSDGDGTACEVDEGEDTADLVIPAGDAAVIADADVPLGSVSTGAM